MRRANYTLSMVLMMVVFITGQAFAFDPDAPNGGMPLPMPPGVMPPGAFPPGMMPPGAVPPNGLPPGAPADNAPLPPELVAKEHPTSLFMTDVETRKINEAIAQHKILVESQNAKAVANAKNFLNQMDKVVADVQEPPKPVNFTYPQFFLQYLSYHGENEWLVIVNGQKFSPGYEAANSWLRVLAVNKEMVAMEWTPQALDMVTKTWNALPVSETKGDVKVDNTFGTVTFVLKPNQTFSSYAMRVVEGKIAPVTITLMPEQTAAGLVGSAIQEIAPAVPPPAATTANAAPSPATGPAEEESKTGPKALDATYKKMGLEP